MFTVDWNKVQKLREELAQMGCIAAVWSTQDVQQLAPNLSDEQAFEILDDVLDHQDCSEGINWTVVRECIERKVSEVHLVDQFQFGDFYIHDKDGEPHKIVAENRARAIEIARHMGIDVASA